MKWLIKKMKNPVLGSLMISVLMGVSLAASCSNNLHNQAGNKGRPSIDSKPREAPVALQPSKDNKGKRCEDRQYIMEEEEGGIYRECFRLQKRLGEAAKNGDLTEIRDALKDGASIEGTYYDSYPALHTAALFGHTDAVILLLDNGANVNHKVNFEKDPLTMAASEGHIEIVKVLLARGADVCFNTTSGTAAKIAQDRGFKDLAELLKEAESAAHCK